MTSLPVKSWLSFSEGLLAPAEVVSAIKQKGFDTIVLADSGDVGGTRDFLRQAEKENINAVVGVEFLLVSGGIARRATGFSRGAGGMGDFFQMVAKFNHPKDPNRPKGVLLPGCDYDLPLLGLSDIPKGVIVVSGGKESYFEDCRSRGDLRSFLKFVDEARGRGVSVVAGYDPGLADQRDRSFLTGLRKHPRPVPILPWRWTACNAGDEEKFNGAVRSVFGKSPDPVSLRVGVCFDSMESLDPQGRTSRDIDGFIKASLIAPGEAQFSADTEPELRFRGSDGQDLTQEQACDVLKKTSLKSLETLISKTGLKGERATARKQIYLDRIDSEIKDIAECKVAGRILHVAELMSFCRKSGIKAMARGSVANSLICYLNRIHPINPVTFGLPSQRFVNPKRKTTPDIDIDIAASRAEEARDFLCQAGGGGVGLRSTITSGFVDILQRELKSAGVPFAHEIRERLKTSFGGRRVPNTYSELEEEFVKYAKASKLVAGDDFVSFLCSKMPSTDKETMVAAIETAKVLEGRPIYHIDHVGVAMKTTGHSPYSPITRGSNGKPLLAVPHDQAEQWGFCKIDVLSRRALDLVERVQTSIEKNGGKLRSVGAVFSATRKNLPEIRMGLVGGLDQIGGGGKGQIPHRQFLSSWEDEFTNFDLINYLALVRYGSHGWSKDNRPAGEFRPKILALYCGNFSAGSTLVELGNACSRKYRESVEGNVDVSKWTELAKRGGGEDLTNASVVEALKKLPSHLAKTGNLEQGDVGEQILARITWDGREDKKKHLSKCKVALSKKRAGDDSLIRTMLADFYGLRDSDEVIVSASNSLSSGKVIERPPYISDLGGAGVEIWDRVTSETRGLLLFQEQVTDLLCQLSGCSYSSADLVRDAVAHRGRSIPEEVKTEIQEGVEKKTGVAGGGGKLMQALTEDGPYLFNKGHAAVYAGLITWQLEAKKSWPASFSQGYIGYLRNTGGKGSDVASTMGAVLGDAEKLGCRIDISELPSRARTEASETVGKPGVLKLGLDAFCCLGDDLINRWDSLGVEAKKSISRVRDAEQLHRAPFHLAPEEAEIIFALTRGTKEKARVFQKHLGLLPEIVRSDLAPRSTGASAAEDLNVYRRSGAKTSNAWGFVAAPPHIYPGGGKRPCRVTCSLGTGDGRSPSEISYVFWAERGKESGHFLPKEAVDLQSRLNSFFLRNVPISTVVKLNDFFARWDGSVATIRPVGGEDKNLGDQRGRVEDKAKRIATDPEIPLSGVAKKRLDEREKKHTNASQVI